MGDITLKQSQYDLKEKDIEDWLWNNVSELKSIFGSDFNWVSRQLKMPTGIVDLLGIASRLIYVIELKNVPISSDALAQVLRYAGDIRELITAFEAENNYFNTFSVCPVIIAPGDIDNKLLHSCEASGVIVHSFDLSFSLELSGRWKFNREYIQESIYQINHLMEHEDLRFIGKTIEDLSSLSYDITAEFEEAIRNATSS